MTEFLLQSDITEIAANLRELAPEFAGKHVLLTGGRGFLGRYFTAVFQRFNETLLAENPVRVTVLDNLISAGVEGARIPTIPHMRFINHDVRQPFGCFARSGLWGDAVNADHVDFILHAAGIASPAHYRKFPLETLEVATRGTQNALELARANPGCRIAFFSSSEIYGDPDAANVPTLETYRGNVACLGPRACYDMSKRLGETLVQIYAEQYGVHGTIIRPFNVYGPGMQKHDYRVLPNFAARIAADLPLEVYGSGNQTRTYCYVTDAIGGFLRVLLHGAAGEPYNVGNPLPEVSVLELADRIKFMHQQPGIGTWRDVEVTIMPHPPSYPADEPNRRCPSIAKIAALGYAPRVDLDTGLRRFFDWALEAFAVDQAA